MVDDSSQGELFPLPHTGERVSKSARGILDSAFTEDEPVFVIRAKDILAVPTLDFYIQRRFNLGPNDTQFGEDLDKIRDAFAQWQRANPLKVRFPD